MSEEFKHLQFYNDHNDTATNLQTCRHVTINTTRKCCSFPLDNCHVLQLCWHEYRLSVCLVVYSIVSVLLQFTPASYTNILYHLNQFYTTCLGM